MADLLASRWPSNDLLSIEDGFRARLERRDEGPRVGSTCGFALPLAAVDAEKSPILAPLAGQLARVTSFFWALPAGASDAGCELTLDPKRFYRPGRGSFTFREFADTDAAIAGAQLVGYLSSELFVAGGRSAADLAAMTEENSSERSHQAE